MSGVRLMLLTAIPTTEWAAVRSALQQFHVPPDQAAYGGIPQGFVALEVEPGRHVFLIYFEESLVGVGSLLTGSIHPGLWPLQTPAVQLRGFVIDERMQGKGIGTEASRQVISLAKSVDPEATHLTLTVNQKNPGARRTYEKAGFITLPDPYTGGPLGPQDIMYVDLA